MSKNKIKGGILNKRLTPTKQVLKKNQMTVSIPDYKAPSILNDENRFFKGEMDREKKSMFFE